MSQEYPNKEYFVIFLKTVRGVSDTSVGHYLDALNNISRRLVKKGLIKDHIFEITELSYLEEIKEILYSDPDFLAQNKKGNRMYSAGLNNYCKFAEGDGLETVKDKVLELDIPIKPPVKHSANNEKWDRSSIVREQAIALADYNCEMDPSHKTFIAAKTNHQYMEGHHAIPMRLQGEFNNSLDVYANIVCMCPICHRRIHYGLSEDKKQMMNQIYDKRADRLYKSGLRLSKEEFSMFA